MAYTEEQAQSEILASTAAAATRIGFALAELSEAHELLDEQTADRLEEELFLPVQRAFSRARKTHVEFAQRCGRAQQAFEQPPRGAPSHGAKGFVESAVEQVAAAERALAELQDSMLPVEAGDPALRAGLSEVRELLASVPARARELLRTLGR